MCCWLVDVPSFCKLVCWKYYLSLTYFWVDEISSRTNQTELTMPGYEMALIMRVMKRPDLISAVKRSIGAVMEQGGIVKNLENLGEKRLPYRMIAHTEHFTRGHYFIVEFDSPPDAIPSVKEYLHRDVDVIRPTILNRETERREPPLCPGAYTGRYKLPERIIWNKKKLRHDVKVDDLSK